MKHAAVLAVLLASSGVLLGDAPAPSSRQPATLLEDLVRMTRAGSSDVTVLAYAKAHRLELPPELSDANLRWLRDSGVSQLVVRYMTAVDLRASSGAAQESASYGSSEDTAHSLAAYSSEGDDDSESDGGRDPERLAGGGRYPDAGADADSGYGYGSDYGFGDGYYPTFGYGYGYYPYASYFFVDRGGSFRRFHGRHDRSGGHRRFDDGPRRGRRGAVAGHGGSHDAWRERGSGGRRGGSVVAGPRGSGSPAFASRGFVARPHGPRERGSGDRGFARPGSGRGEIARGFGGPRGAGGGRAGRGGFLSGGPRGGGFRQGPAGIPGGGRPAAGSPRGRGSR